MWDLERGQHRPYFTHRVRLGTLMDTEEHCHARALLDLPGWGCVNSAVGVVVNSTNSSKESRTTTMQSGRSGSTSPMGRGALLTKGGSSLFPAGVGVGVNSAVGVGVNSASQCGWGYRSIG